VLFPGHSLEVDQLWIGGEHRQTVLPLLRGMTGQRIPDILWESEESLENGPPSMQ
jgi:hypothetical protein